MLQGVLGEEYSGAFPTLGLRLGLGLGLGVRISSGLGHPLGELLELLDQGCSLVQAALCLPKGEVKGEVKGDGLRVRFRLRLTVTHALGAWSGWAALGSGLSGAAGLSGVGASPWVNSSWSSTPSLLLSSRSKICKRSQGPGP